MRLNFDFVDKSFRPAGSANYRLSIQMSLNGFSFCIYDIAHGKHVVIESFGFADEDDLQNKIVGVLTGIPGFKNAFPVKVLYLTRKNVIIPANVFDENKVNEYLSFWFPVGDYDEIALQYMPGIEAYICYAVPSRLIMKLHERFENVKVFNQTYNNIRQIYRDPGDTKLKLIFCGDFVDLTVFKNNALILNNTFEVGDIRDVVYFLAAITQKTDTVNAPVYVSGDIVPEGIRTLKSFFPNLHQNHDKKMTLRLGQDVSSKYYNLLLLHECE